MRRGTLIRITAAFFALMLLFTILSRAAYQSGTAVVSVARPDSRMITHQVTAAGKMRENREMAVVTEPGLRVAAICVQEGEKVERGDVLFEIDTALLDEMILKQKQELEKQKLQTDDTKSAKSARAQRQSNAVAEAEESASLRNSRASAALKRARQALEEAKRAQADGAGNSGNQTDTSEVEAALRNAVAEAEAALDEANQALSTLEWRIERAVEEALRGAQEDGVGTAAGGRMTAAAGSGTAVVLKTAFFAEDWEACEDEIIDEWNSGLDEELVGLDDWGNDFEEETADFQGGYDGLEEEIADFDGNYDGFEEETVDFDEGDIGVEEEIEDMDEGDSDWTEGNGRDGSEIPDEFVPKRAISQEELDEIEREVRESFRPELEKAKENVTAAEDARDEANAALAQYQAAVDSASQASSAETQSKLNEAVKSAQENYEDAARDANEAAVTGNRSIATAALPEGSDSSDRIAEITYEQMELALEKLEKIKADEGKIRAPGDGLVTKIELMTGGQTTDTTAMLLTDLAQGYHFTADLTKEQEKYIGTGDLVTITSDNGKQKAEEVPVTSVRSDEEDDSIYHITVQLQDDSFALGTAATLEYTKKSQVYSVCVPLTALHLDDKNQAYVLVPDTYQSIMGTELRARKVNVTVLEKNEQYAALADGSLSSQDTVIVQSDRTVEEGSRVRVDG